MKIVTCPKGGRIPEGYCRQSCSNYPGKAHVGKSVSEKRPREISLTKKNPFIS